MSDFPPPPRKFAEGFSILWILFVLTFAIRLALLVGFSRSSEFLPEGDDMQFYNAWATRILQGHFTDGKAFYGLPGYAYCVALIYALTGGMNPFAVGLVQAALEAGTAVVLYRLAIFAFARRAADGSDGMAALRPQIVGTLAALGWAAFVPAQVFSLILMPASWLVFAYWGCVWWVMKTPGVSCWSPWLGLGLICGLVAMMVATILFVIPLIVAGILLKVEAGQPWRARLAKVAAALALLLAGLYTGSAPAWIHNYFIAHEPVMLSAHSGINFWIGNHPSANGYPKIPAGLRASQEGLLKDSITVAERAAGRTLQ
nr:hypothetical protein [Verrucomicrobiota bacterium]